ncbi:DNA/RNA non-specific endonuclease [Cupriavidus taiwanensis]|uniref:DNA/RNA non-specific endonuclease n=1 Tax=Cupriavidus taiwanensis TaxID=164546 RepID=UPI00254265CD|nr:DNA/RNA non-specific endonuclease [Cupriavidus taiwanensis]MDK3022916.1 DNA/RNA non-specific endonuclease [Cupriavidus taiwanensis]
MHKPLFLAAAIVATFVGSTISTGLSTAAYAKGPATECPHIFGTNGKPSVANSATASRTQFLCFRGYAVQTSATTRTALWSAENLTAQAVLAARSVPRDSDFYEEVEIPAADRARLSDYGRGTGLDRGHLAPSGDFPDLASQAESFSLANIVPQAAASNRRLWSHIETSTRRMVREYGQAFVVTGPADPAQAARLNGRISIPTYMWKAVYVPGVGAAAYVARNDATPRYAVVSVAELVSFAGVDPFPRLDRSYRDAPMTLLAPTPHPGEKSGRKVSLATLTSTAVEWPAQREAQEPRHSGVLPFVRAVFTHY